MTKFRSVKYVYDLIDVDDKTYLTNHPDLYKINDSLQEYMRTEVRDNRDRKGYGYPIDIEGGNNIG